MKRLLLCSELLALCAFGQRIPADALLPDIQEQIPYHLAIQNEQQREMLRFSTGHVNLGKGWLQILGGGQVAPCTVAGVDYEQCTHATQQVLNASGQVVYEKLAGAALFHPEHNHWHQSDVALFEIRKGTLDGPLVGSGKKVTFCLVDLERIEGIKTTKTRTYYDCNGVLQGISPGWADLYHHSTEGQELEITGAEEGEYYLTHLANPSLNWLESSYKDNFAWVKFRLVRQGANPSIEILGNSPCVEGQTCAGTSNR